MIRLLADRRIKGLFATVLLTIFAFTILNVVLVHRLGQQAGGALIICAFGMMFLIGGLLVRFFYRQDALIASAITQIKAFLSGDTDARIVCDEEGEFYRLFHEINALAAILNAHAENEEKSKRLMKDTLSDISHQLKTPLATLNIYHGIMQDSSNDLETLRTFSALSEQELDRIEQLVKNLLTISKLDAGTLVFEKTNEDVSALMNTLKHRFSYQAEMEKKILSFSGEPSIVLLCDCTWILEALTNIIKNAFDHTCAGDSISITWHQFAQIIQIVVRDNGSGIHPEDLPHIFKRFYRSRFSSDIQGVGLGLPLAKAIIEAHSGTIEVDGHLGEGTTFTINFLIPTIL